MAFCNNCGAYLPEGTTVCSSCGATVTPPQDYQNQNSYQNPNPNPNQDFQYNYQNNYQSNFQGGGYQNGGFQYNYQNNYQGGYGARQGYQANIRRREIAVAIILTIVTCGIYGLVWFFNLVSDLNTAVPEVNDKEAGTVLLLTIVTCGIYGWIWIYNAGNKVDRIRQMNGEAPSNSGLIYLLLCLFGLGIVAYALIQSELNKVATLV